VQCGVRRVDGRRAAVVAAGDHQARGDIGPVLASKELEILLEDRPQADTGLETAMTARPVSSNCTPLRRSVQRFGAIVTTPVPVRIALSLRADMIFGKDRFTFPTDWRTRSTPGVALKRLAATGPR
jgi:hypothetical protein